MAHTPERYFLMHKHDDDDYSQYWFHQVGWLGYYFAQLEWATFWLANNVGSKADGKSISSKGFAARCKEARKNLVPKIKDAQLQREWDAFLIQIAACGRTRNDILHNPLEINIEEMAKNGVTIDQGILLLREKGRKVLGLGDVQHFTKNLMALNAAMIDLMKRTNPS